MSEGCYIYLYHNVINDLHLFSAVGLAIHPWEPLLISCSLDGTLRMWRLDTFEVVSGEYFGDKVFVKLSLEDTKCWPFKFISSKQLGRDKILSILKHKFQLYLYLRYRKTSNISHTLVGNKIVDHSDVVGASAVGAAPTTSSFST